MYYQGSKVDAVCGAANGGGFTSIPTFNLCLAGSLSGGIVAGTNVWTRTCKGVNSGEKADCFANQVLPDTPSVPTTPTTGYP
ncbi:MAG: hypothetical protein LBP53_03715 [Candidatus Peribacteria bacterium]|nr:hypothetical protein [Candidatus Peribacteria bacterium]